ncbi:hypothetical protein [Leadbetterella sp. DM7]|uniref:Imm32 family immunity protein n=1 Tax=Leadbetterella sp. DM7 TaxID=3235085 RepID=UPI00349E684D
MKKVEVKIPEYNANDGFQYKWEDGFEIEVQESNGVVIIVANKEGLLSLANHLINLAQDSVPSNTHLHFDRYNSLEDNSSELIVEKK